MNFEVRKQSKTCIREELRRRKWKHGPNLKLELFHEILIPMPQVYKKSSNDYTGPVNLSIILNVDLAQESLYVKPVDNNLDTKKAIGNYNHHAAGCM